MPRPPPETETVADPALQLALPARPENVLIVRQAVAGLGEAMGLPSSGWTT